VRFDAVVLGLAAGLFVAMLVFLEIGHRLGRRRLERDPEAARAGVASVEGAVFALLGLLIAFTFSGAASRFDTRRHLIVDETTATSTAWSRVDLLPDEAQPAIRDSFRRYLDARLAAYRKLPDVDAAFRELAHAQRIQDELWARAIEALRPPSLAPVRILVLAPLNQMFDVATARTLATRMHPPPVVFAMLGFVAIAGALFAGHAMAAARERSWLHVVGLPLAVAVAVFVIVELEYPRLGFIRVDDFDQALVELRATMTK
jgi:hypothetical protein